MSLAARVKIDFTGTLTHSFGIGSTTTTFPFTKTITFANGTAVNQSDVLYMARRTITDSSTPDSFDLAGTLLNPVGAAAVFAEITGIIISKVTATVGEVLTVGGDAAALSTWLGNANDVIKVGPGGFIALINPAAAAYGVTATTADKLQVATSAGTSVLYDVVILGRTA